MNTRNLWKACALALALFAAGAHAREGAEGHGCPSRTFLTCEAVAGDKVVVDWSSPNCAAPVVTVKRAEKTAKFTAVRSARARRANSPDAVYGQDFLLLLWIDGRQTPVTGVTGQLETYVDGRRISREVVCDVYGLR